jgi:predicted nucleic acid-binding protein
MSRLVVPDCSVSAAWCLPDENSMHARRILADIHAGTTALLVPALWWYEVLNVLKVAVKRNRLSRQQASEAARFLANIPLDVVTLGGSGESSVLNQAIDDDLTAYDASYLHLAVSSGAELVTLDKDLLALQRKYASIKSPQEY